MRLALNEVADMFGVPLSEELEGPPADPVFSRTDDGSPEQAFATRASAVLRALRGRGFSTPRGATLSISKTKRPLVHRRKDAVDYVVPLVVTYDGKASAEEWAGVERQAEAEILALLQANTGEVGPIKMVRRAKVDPFVDDPASLTLLRFRSSKRPSAPVTSQG
jgi:hypothetical protein